MTGSKAFHALGLHMYQPPGNFKLLIETNPWEAEQIIRCYDRGARCALKYRDLAHAERDLGLAGDGP